MKTTTKRTLLLSTAMIGTAISLPLDSDQAKAATKPISSEKTLEVNQLLTFGATGPQVLELQSYLKTFDYYKGRKDGVFGPLTKQAITTYQKTHQLKVDGIAGPETISHLLLASDVKRNKDENKSSVTETKNNPDQAITSENGSASLKGESIRTFKQGDRGERVSELQQQLAEYGYYQGVDGIYGPKTTAAVKQFQRAHQLQVDGIIGPKTKAMLEEADHVIHAPETNQTADSNTSTVKNEPSNENSTSSSNVIQTATSLKGSPYVWGGTSPAGFDCSGFIQYVFKQHGKSVPRTTSDLYQQGQAVSNLQVGDIVFFTTYRSGPSHAGIYLGNRQFIHVGSSTGVATASLDQSYWSTRYLGAKRF
ncbi:hypothetical protein JCM9140_988 [Halalkalibacter wakoensis JCM 9140]|uniref:NlpC/P60 domain-containing protein n=1 Tax=Halalkalibacter wakoensis JCM 9140 TaxID=1236970 RepID=W4Q0X7_9BACI|nr:peptidoglycan-binding protein [Halalkalibacter wakoensis]GAE25019.1 hypothetical protein JCM9140_988 [Halalkalibacter wakoensis JCM 9140]